MSRPKAKKKDRAPVERPVSEKEALYRAVMASPDDDLPRLVMADCR